MPNPEEQPLLRTLKLAIAGLLSGHLLLGLAWIAFLPPWEGFDETAHYSYLQQLSDKGQSPFNNSGFISTDVETYYDFAPVSYSLATALGEDVSFTYKTFFESFPETLEEAARHIHHPPASPRVYEPSDSRNWQFQHPPLYYLVLAPVYKMTQSMSWGMQLMILRSASYLIAWMAMAVGVAGCFYMARKRSLAKHPTLPLWAALGIGLWPLLFPAWYADMARMGNDSLCALLVAAIWFLMIKQAENEVSLWFCLTLGMLLGLGCLSKAFFIPVSAGLLIFLIWKVGHLRARLPDRETGNEYLFVAAAALVLFAVCGLWYLMNYIKLGILVGSEEMIDLNRSGGLVKEIPKKFTLMAWFRGHIAMFTTFAWAGSWSWARPPFIFLGPMLGGVFFAAGIYFLNLRRFAMTSAAWVPVWLTLPMLLGFSYHVLVRMALTGQGSGTGGYYLHIMVVPLATALGMGIGEIWHRKILRTVLLGWLCYAILFTLVTAWAQILLYSGIVSITESGKFYQLPETLPFLLGLPQAFQQMHILGFPVWGLCVGLLGLAATGAGLVFGKRCAKALELSKSREKSNALESR